MDFGSLTNPNINRSGFGTTLLFCVPKTFEGFREFYQYGIKESYYDDWEEKQIPETYLERRIIPKQFCIGYLDVENKKFIVNPSFQLNYGIQDEFQQGYAQFQNEVTDLSTHLFRR